MDSTSIKNILKSTIWVCLGVIIFSPLYINTSLFFPFIVSKTLAFNIAVEVMLLAFLALSFYDKNYRLIINTVVALFGIYLVVSFLSSFLGDNFYRSFWSNNERSEGLLLYMHLFAFLAVLSSFFRKFKDWLNIFDLSFLASILVSLTALDQYFGFNILMNYSGGNRLTGTIGNAGYMAGYLIFAVFFGLLLLFKRRNPYARAYYLIGILLAFFIAVFTETRGGIIALGLGSFVFLVYLSLFYFKDRIFKYIGIIIIVAALLIPTFLLINRDSDFVTGNSILNRMTHISTSNTTSQTRLMTWGSALQGFKDRPVFGWGAENFYQPFDKYFNPAIYRHAGSVIWFDRAHNVIFDRLLTGGIIGLISYLSFIFLPLYYLWLYFYKKGKDDKKSYLVPLIFTLLIVSYFIQNLFIFEALVIYVPLFLSLSFVGLFSREYKIKSLSSQQIKSYLLILLVVLFIPMVYYFHIKPLKSNTELVRVLSGREQGSVQKRFAQMDALIADGTYGNQEYRQQYFNLFNNLAVKYRTSDDKTAHQALAEISKTAEKQFKQQIQENPHSISNYLLLMRFNNAAYIYDLNRLNNNIEIFNEALKLSATRAHLYYEMAYSYLYLGNYFSSNNEVDKAKQAYDLSVDNLKTALELNDQNTEPYRQLISILVATGRNEEAIKYADQVKTLTTYGNKTWADDLVKDIRIK
jgi:O-antigen ligase